MATSDADGKLDENDKTKISVEAEEKGKTFRKRRLSLTKLRQLDYDSGEDDNNRDNNDRIGRSTLISTDLVESEEKSNTDNDKAHTFRKRRLSLTSSNGEITSSLASESEEQSPTPFKRLRKASDASVSDPCSTYAVTGGSNNLKSKTLHAAEILSPSPSDSALLPKFYQEAAPPQQFSFANKPEMKTPKWKERHVQQHIEDDKSLPFPRDVVGTFSCHGVEPIYDDGDSHYSLGEDNEDTADDNHEMSTRKKLTMAAKINQDRGGMAFPYGNSARSALFAVYDGHGQGGELVSQYALHEIQRLLEKHPDFNKNIENAFKETFLQVNSALKGERLIEPLYAGTTACVALLRDKQLILSNAGDSRAVLARKIDCVGDDSWDVIDLTEDQNPDLPAEKERIERMGGYVSPPPEPGLSSRVWLDEEWSQIGLAMARSIGDHAVKSVGVIAEPVVSFHKIHENDCFLILATDGVWEFISSTEAVNIIAKNLHKGATKACQVLIETAAEKWHDEEGDYRDDITALVIRLQHLLEPE
mmetsp:Transcript_10379/g.25117  ORF Transcript_10379/g.25117 Transcript_10379/m.25117 type:complete len:531 (+) Transcript_10379:105-1697(+)